MGGHPPVKAVVVGMGARAQIYAREALRHPERLQIVGVADVNPEAVRLARETYGIPKANCFPSAEALAAAPKFADAAINGTMDPLHVATTVPLLRRGYDVLLEKPFALNQSQADVLLRCARETGRKVMVCHVLRYAPFYRALKEQIMGGALGAILHIHLAEQVSYFHESVSYVRGKYASPEVCGSGMLLSKCCHDLDLMAWLMAETRPRQVASIGSLFQYRPSMAPQGAGTHCLLDCPVERECVYSARRLYLEHPQRWTANIWHDSGLEGCSPADRELLLRDPENPYSRCVYRCDLKLVDHQSVMVGFENGATGTFTMNGGAAAAGRYVHITGTLGEAIGRFEDGALTVRRICPEATAGMVETTVVPPPVEHEDEHGGGDQALVRDFVALLWGEPPSICCTSLEDSVAGHRLAFLAEDSRAQGGAMIPW
ncbi:MAG TPA: Gfo/Idh/MocA family oxidoreductase [Candidatus Limiplasma sp.]|nr:Gfo/Idh/MocA family oxidoreductase [Candidatus Limiplasma sp.]